LYNENIPYTYRAFPPSNYTYSGYIINGVYIIYIVTIRRTGVPVGIALGWVHLDSDARFDLSR